MIFHGARPFLVVGRMPANLTLICRPHPTCYVTGSLPHTKPCWLPCFEKLGTTTHGPLCISFDDSRLITCWALLGVFPNPAPVAPFGLVLRARLWKHHHGHGHFGKVARTCSWSLFATSSTLRNVTYRYCPSSTLGGCLCGTSILMEGAGSCGHPTQLMRCAELAPSLVAHQPRSRCTVAWAIHVKPASVLFHLGEARSRSSALRKTRYARPRPNH